MLSCSKWFSFVADDGYILEFAESDTLFVCLLPVVAFPIVDYTI